MAKQHPEAFDILINYLNLSFQDSFSDSLLKDGFVVDQYVGHHQINNMTLGYVDFTLTEKGGRQYQKVLRRFLSTLKYLGTEELPDDILNFLKATKINEYSEALDSTISSADTIADSLLVSNDTQRFLDFKNRFGQVTKQQVLQLARDAFNHEKIADNMLVGYIGPEIKVNADAPVIPAFNLKYRVRSDLLNFAWLRNLNYQPTPKLVEVPLNPTEVKQKKEWPLQSVTVDPYFKTHLIETHSDDRGAILLSLELPPTSPSMRAALDLYVDAFKQRFPAQIGYLQSLGVHIDITTTIRGLKFEIQGNAGSSLGIAKWLLEEFLNFAPATGEIQSAVDGAKAELDDANTEFSAKQALAYVHLITRRRQVAATDLVEIKSKLSLKSVKSMVSETLGRADINLYMLGNFSKKDPKSLAKLLTKLFPERLTEKQRQRNAASELPISQSFRFGVQLPTNKDSNEYGRTRVYSGVEPYTIEHAAIAVLNAALDKAVFQHNRTERSLGYIHRTKLIEREGRIDLAFYGETSDPNRRAEIEQGWDHVVDLALRGILSTNQFQEDILGLIRGLQLQPETNLEQLADLSLSNEIFGNLRGRTRMQKLLERLTADDVNRVAQLVLTQGRIDIEASRDLKSLCSGFLTSVPYAQRRLAP